MKPYFTFLCSIGLALQTLITTAAEPISPVQDDDHKIPVAQQAAATVTIPDSFAPFGARPDTDKIGDDGSAAVRDRNGVIIWSNKDNQAALIPNSSLAKTLYVSNTECVVYSNRYAKDYNIWGSVSNLIIYRRAPDGSIVASPTITVRGTVLDTSPVTPNSFGFSIVAAYGWNFRTNESTVTNWTKKTVGTGDNQTVEYSKSVVEVDQWHNINYEMYRITWDAQVQSLNFTTVDVPKTNTNLGGTRVLGNGDDGSAVINTLVAGSYNEDREDFDPNAARDYFVTTRQSLWAIWQINSEDIQTVDFSVRLPTVAYVSNGRLLLQSEITNFSGSFFEIPTGNYRISDYRLSSNGISYLAGSSDLDPGDSLLSVNSYTRSALPPYLYAINGTGRRLKLYLYDDTLKPLGGALALQAPVTSGSAFVRNPRDASLLIKSNSTAEILWIPSNSATTPTALTAAKSLPNSTLGLPMFVSSTEAVAWMNSGAPVDLASGGQLPYAQITHFSASLAATVLAPPIEGRYVTLPSPLTQDPESEGWFVTTFEKRSSFTALVRTYILQTPNTADLDGDGLTNSDEISPDPSRPYPTSITDIGDPDTDGDGILDGLEVHPFRIVTGAFTYEEARLDAIRRGGRLTVLNTLAKTDQLKKQLGNDNGGLRLWLGGGDMEGGTELANSREGNYQWVDAFGQFFNAAGVRTSVPITVFNWDIGQPGNTGNADGLQLEANYKWSLAPVGQKQGYVLELVATNPTVADTDGDGLNDGGEVTSGTNPLVADTDGDGLSDGAEKTLGSNPLVADTDGDGLSDGSEVTGGTNPLLVDTDGDGLSDSSEITGGTNPLLADTDSDGLNDGSEITGGTDPLVADTDGDGLNDGNERTLGTNPLVADTDGDGLSDGTEATLGTNPLVADTDGDGLSDSAERTLRTNPLLADTDGDGLSDGAEVSGTGGFTSNPLLRDTDNDGFTDSQEINAVPPTNPNDPASRPPGLPAEPLYNYSQLKNEVPVTIPVPYTPFGNRLEFNRYGDDGSKCVLDANGVLTWIDSEGVVRLLPNTSKAIPLFVTNSECLVWDNRFADYNSYPTRPSASLVLFRAVAGSSAVTSSPVAFQGKEVVETAPTTTTTGALTFISTTRRDGGSTPLFIPDQCDIRFYRVTFDAGVQFVRALSIPIEPSLPFATGVTGPDINATGYGSDGSMAIKISRVALDSSPFFEDQYHWFDSQGRSVLIIKTAAVVEDLNASPPVFAVPAVTESVSQVLFCSNNRLVYADAAGVIKEQRRSVSTGALIGTPTVIPGVIGTVLDLANYARVGDQKFIYTLDPDGKTVRTYLLGSAAILQSTAVLTNAITTSAVTGTVNPVDGSALIFDEDSTQLIWLHVDGGGFSYIGSSQSRPLYVTNKQAVIWENATASAGGNGTLPPAVVAHYSLTLPSTVLRTVVATIGTNLLNTSRITPDFDYWLFTTSRKATADTSLLTTYKLAPLEFLDDDNDGLSNADELSPDPSRPYPTAITDIGDPDTDGDGISDGLEVHPFRIITGAFTYEEARLDAIRRGGRLTVPDTLAKIDQLKKQLVNDNAGLRLWLGGGDMEGGTEPANSREGNYQWVDAFGQLFNAAGVRTSVPITVFNWNTAQPSNTGNADGLQLDTNYKWSLAPVSQRQGYVLELVATNPTVADTDGDGLSDGSEVAGGTNPTLADTDGDGLNDGSEVTGGTNPTLADTDGDGLSDSVERTLGTNPVLADTDGDGLNDGVEVNGPGFTSNPLLVDTDGDGASDFDEKNAVPPTDPRNASSVPPVIIATGPKHNRPVTYLAPQTVTLPSSFAPFGQRPDTDKIGDDGSAAFRDRNGVLIWSDKLGKAVLIPNSSLARTLYVSNSECVVYANRYAEDYNIWGSVSNIIIYRRATDGTVTASPTITVRGTVLDTCPVTPSSYGFTIIAAYGYNFSTTDSRQNGKDVDQWHNINYEQYRINWDGVAQKLKFTTVYVPKTNTNLVDTRILGHGDDGSVAFANDFVALDFDDRSDDEDPGVFKTGQAILWASWQINSESIAVTPVSGGEDREVAYVSNSRLLLEEAIVNETTGIETGNYEILDYRMSLNGLVDLAGSSPLPVGRSLLPVSSYTRSGLPAYVYTVNTAGTQIQLNRYDDALIPLGGPVALPAKVVDGSRYVRNPRDGSLLIKSTGTAGVIWIPSTGYSSTTPATGLRTPRSLPNSSAALPMFVSSSEAVAWMNFGASVDLGAGGVLPLAQISHFSTSTAGGIAIKSLTPPIVGRYVALPSPLTPDPDSEGWFINTFEKTSDRAARILTYQLLEEDTDGDGLSDRLEGGYGTNPLVSDTDGDGLNDGNEVSQGTNPLLADTDADGLSDGAEVLLGTDPLVADTDGDGRLDGDEVNAGTDPLVADLPDTDGDGVIDADESEILLTDPLVPSFGPGTGTEAIPFSSSLVSGDYAGLVFDPKSGQTFKQNLRLSSKGSFSSSLLGLVADSSFKGSFSATGAFTGVPNPTSGLISVQMNLVKQGVNKYFVEGNFKTRTGGTLYFQLRHTLYSKSYAYPSAGKVTFEAALSASDSGPSGSAVATGSISASGQVAFKIYLPDGSTSSYSAPIVDGDLIPLFSRSSSKARTALLGALKLQDLAGQSDFDGSVRLFSAAGASGSLFPSGFDQLRELTGSRYYPPAKGVLPLASFVPSANNAVFTWAGGNFDGVQKVGTWATNGKMTIPPTQSDKAKATFTSSSGLLTVSYTRTDTTRSLLNATSKGCAVVVQKSKTFKGYYTSGLSAGDFVVDPNTSGLNPEITSVSPLNKSVDAAATSYTVTVGTAGAWTVVIPSSVSWITATVSSAAGDTGSSLTTSGSGNGTVVINVDFNAINARREAEITIAGIKHTIKQEFY